MLIQMLEYNQCKRSYLPAGQVNTKDQSLPDALACFIHDSGITDFSIILRDDMINDLKSDLRYEEEETDINEMIDNHKHPFSLSTSADFGYAVFKGSYILLMPGSPFEMDIQSANTILKLTFGIKEKQRYVLTLLNIVH